MQRTSIMLPNDLKSRAAQYARRQGMSLGLFIRKSLESMLGQDANGASKYDPLFNDRQVYHGNTPNDLARNHDKYLYGEAP